MSPRPNGSPESVGAAPEAVAIDINASLDAIREAAIAGNTQEVIETIDAIRAQAEAPVEAAPAAATHTGSRNRGFGRGALAAVLAVGAISGSTVATAATSGTTPETTPAATSTTTPTPTPKAISGGVSVFGTTAETTPAKTTPAKTTPAKTTPTTTPEATSPTTPGTTTPTPTTPATTTPEATTPTGTTPVGTTPEATPTTTPTPTPKPNEDKIDHVYANGNIASMVEDLKPKNVHETNEILRKFGNTYFTAESNNINNKMNAMDKNATRAEMKLAAGLLTFSDSHEGNQYGKGAINFNTKFDRDINADTGMTPKEQEVFNKKFLTDPNTLCTIKRDQSGWYYNGYMKDGGEMNAQLEYFNGEDLLVCRSEEYGTLTFKITIDKDGKICLNLVKKAPAPETPVTTPSGGDTPNPGHRTPEITGTFHPNKPKPGKKPTTTQDNNTNPDKPTTEDKKKCEPGYEKDKDSERCIHTPNTRPAPGAEQEPHPTKPTEGYKPGDAETIVPSQQGDPENLDKTDNGTKVPDSKDGVKAPGGGDSSVVDTKPTGDNPEHVDGTASNGSNQSTSNSSGNPTTGGSGQSNNNDNGAPGITK